MKHSIRLVRMLFVLTGALAACDPAIVTEHLGTLRPDAPSDPDPMACACGPNRPAISCADGNDDWQCQRTDDGSSCRWVLSCTGEDPLPAPCEKDECGTMEPVACTSIVDVQICVETPGCYYYPGREGNGHCAGGDPVTTDGPGMAK